MKIAGYIKTSLIEWPGKISSVIFVPGCNFRCPFCHNADLVLERGFSRLPAGKAGISEKRVLADLASRKGWIDAVVVTGGEPTLQKDLPEFFKALRKLKLLIAIHTNGSNPEVLKKLLKEKLLDFIAMDLKGDFENYDKYTGIQKSKVNPPAGGQNYNSKVKMTMELIVNSGVGYEFRTTVVPGLHGLENLTKLAEQLRTTVYGLQSTVDGRQKTVDGPKWYLQQFRPMNCLDKNYLKVKPFSKDQMQEFLAAIKKFVPNSSLRGV